MNLFRQVTANNILMKNYPFIKELAMEAYLIENQEILKLDDTDFSEVSILDAEIALKKGRANGDGRIDILAKYGSDYLAIVELKLDYINEGSLKQLEEYLEQREQILNISTDYWSEDERPKWIGVLVGSFISSELEKKLLEGYKYKEIPIAGITLKRYRTENNEIFVISDTFFKYNYTAKDYSRFSFNGEEYNKGRLVNTVIKKYIEDNPEIKFSELKRKFPDKIQGSFGVFNTLEKAEIKSEKNKRYYIEPSEVIQLVDEKIATCNQWNRQNLEEFIKMAREYGYIIDIK